MNGAINELVKSVLKKDSLRDCTVQELRQLAGKYPYFPVPQLLLAQKLKEEDPDDFPVQSDKARLYFQYPQQQDILWGEKGQAVTEQRTPEPPPAAAEEQPVNEALAIADAPEDIPTLPVQAEAEEVITEIPDEAGIKEENKEEDITATAIDETAAFPGTDTGTPATEEEMSAVIPATGLPDSDVIESSDDDDDEYPVPEQEATVLPPIPSLKIEPIDPEKAQLAFTPYHTVDYFASQGIKFREEEKPQDKFGQQLKSFTEWLKTLKKAGPSDTAPAAGNTLSEKKVEQMAAHSLNEKEVLTEAMANVWEKQGNIEKAIAIYDKLSLLNPSKSSYFAARIELLKKS